ncbi:MAG: helix-turn-helix transcriptional regulator [Planctomycetes bacterium]|nr:helix-turn-helix transcriptional regulator [Planctomycetota bacterium]
MDYNKIMQLCDIGQIRARVRLANYHRCQDTQAWLQRRIVDLQLIYVVAGGLNYETDAGICHIEAGQVLLIEPQLKHDLRAVSAQTVISGIHCELAAGSWAGGDYRLHPKPSQVTSVREPESLHQLFKLCAQCFADYGYHAAARCNKICESIVLQLAESWDQESTHQMSYRMQEMIAYIRSNMSEKINRNHLAEAFFVSPEHINYIFKKELRATPSDVINRERCVRAQRYIVEEGRSVKEAAHLVGFNDPLFFSRVFKKFFQIPPSRL